MAKKIRIYIISKKHGFEPLINYIKDREKIPAYIKPSKIDMVTRKSDDQNNKRQLKKVVDSFSDPVKPNKPKIKITLENRIISLCIINQSQAEKMIETLIAEKIIGCDGDKIVYEKM
jgi:hypothetical protein